MSDRDLYVYGAILLLTLCSVLTRAGFMLFGDYIPLPDGVRRALRYAPAAALTAIVVPDLLPWKAGLGRRSTTSWWLAFLPSWRSCVRAARCW